MRLRRVLLLAPLALLAGVGPAFAHWPFARPRPVYLVPAPAVPVVPAVPVAPAAPAFQAPAPVYLTPAPSYFYRPLLLQPWSVAPAAPLVASPPAVTLTLPAGVPAGTLSADLVAVPPGAQAARVGAIPAGGDLDATLRRLTAQMQTMTGFLEMHQVRLNDQEQRLQAIETWWKSKARDGK